MTHSIYRYPVQLVDEQVIWMPAGATILSVARRDGKHTAVGSVVHESVELWAAVDTGQLPQPRRIRVVGTGHPLPDPAGLRHLGTVQVAAGTLVFHIFEETDGVSPVD